MSLIKKAAELDIPSTIRMMIYGAAGAGKTTLALSAPKPLLLDFDGGVKRVNKSHLTDIDTVQVTDWKDIQALMDEDLSSYKTIVVDTVGKMMDFIISYKCGSRQPQIRDWQGINQEFTWFTRSLANLGQNVVFVAHRDTRKDGDDVVFIPSLRDKSYNAIVADLDLLGYVEMKNINGVQTRTITFDPTTRNDGKNTCNLPSVIEIPINVDKSGNAVGENDFIQKSIIKPYSNMLAQKKADVEAYNKLIKEIKDSIEEISDAESATAFVENMKSIKHIGSSKLKALQMLTEKANSLNLHWDKEAKSYVAD